MVSQARKNPVPPQVALRLYESAGERVTPRSKETIGGWFAGTSLVEPGLTLLDEWRMDREPSSSPARLLGYGAVGRIGD
jgi:hypothetical protein